MKELSNNMSDNIGKKVYMFRLDEDNDNDDIFEKLIEEVEKIPAKVYTSDTPGGRKVSEHDEKLKHCNCVVVFITSQFLEKGAWREYFQGAIEDKKCKSSCTCVSVIANRSIKIEKLPLDIRINYCLYYENSANFFMKLQSALTCHLASSASCLLGDIAPGLICSYYYGFLEKVLAKLDKNIADWQKKKFPDGVPRNNVVLKKLINLIPESCKCPDSIENSHVVRDEDYALPLPEDNRCYKTHMYRVSEKEDGEMKFYWMVLSTNATIHSLHEMAENPMAGFPGCSDSFNSFKMRQREMFEFGLQDLLRKKERGDQVAVVSFCVEEMKEKENYLAEEIIKACKKKEWID